MILFRAFDKAMDWTVENRDFDGTRFYAHAKRLEVILSEEWGRRLAPKRLSGMPAQPRRRGAPASSGTIATRDPRTGAVNPWAPRGAGQAIRGVRARLCGLPPGRAVTSANGIDDEGD
ncbi:MAG: hypothetical protein U0R26_09740 [Solirubrobacterales bacterium]